MTRVFIHPLAGVLSAYGMGLADVRALRQRAVEAPLSTAALADAEPVFDELGRVAREEVAAQGIAAGAIAVKRSLHLKYDGTDTTLEIGFGADPSAAPATPGAAHRPDVAALVADFEQRYRTQYGFLMPGKALIIEAAAVEAIGAAAKTDETAPSFPPRAGALRAATINRVYTGGAWKRILDPKMRSPALAVFEGKLSGIAAPIAAAKKPGARFDYDAPIEGLQAIDRYTIRLKFDQPEYSLLSDLTTINTAAVAREVIEAYGDGNGWAMANPVGSGPYRLKEWRRGQRITLEANPGFRDQRYPDSTDPADKSLLATMPPSARGNSWLLNR